MGLTYSLGPTISHISYFFYLLDNLLLERLHGAQGLHGYSLHLGTILSPNLQKHSQEELKAFLTDSRLQIYTIV